jgi:hypothetical protein
MPALDTVLSLDGRNLTTSSRHLWGIRIDTSALVVHARKHPVSEVLPRRKMYWVGRSRDTDRAAGDRACCSNAGRRRVSLMSQGKQKGLKTGTEIDIKSYQCPLLLPTIKTLSNDPAVAAKIVELVERLLNTAMVTHPGCWRHSALHHNSISRP